jgi:hypothetical protein
LPAAEPVKLIRLALGLRGFLLGALRLVRLRLILGLVARVGGPVRDQERGQHRSHVAAGGIMLAQIAGQRGCRHGFEQATGAFVAGVTGAREDLGRAFAGLEIGHLRKRCTACKTAD